jgi:hypothetical protein
VILGIQLLYIHIVVEVALDYLGRPEPGISGDINQDLYVVDRALYRPARSQRSISTGGPIAGDSHAYIQSLEMLLGWQTTACCEPAELTIPVVRFFPDFMRNSV